MSLKREFEAAVKAHFRVLTPLLDAELEGIVTSPFSSETKFLLFEYDSPHFGERFAVSAWPMSKSGEPTATRHTLLEGKAVAVPAKLYDQPKYEAIDHWHLASTLLEGWFVARWKRVLKQLEPRPAIIGHHDSYFKTDLKTGERTNWDEVLKAARATPKSPSQPRKRKRRVRRLA